MIMTFLWLTLSVDTPIETYWLEDQSHRKNEVRLGVQYATNLNSTYSRSQGIIGNFEVFAWRNLSFGILGHIAETTENDLGKNLRELNQVDIETEIRGLDWALFATTNFEIMVGAWNVFNWFECRSRLTGGAGIGYSDKREMQNQQTSRSLVGMGRLETAFLLVDPIELSLGLLYHGSDLFVTSGIQLSIPEKSKSKN